MSLETGGDPLRLIQKFLQFVGLLQRNLIGAPFLVGVLLLIGR